MGTIPFTVWMSVEKNGGGGKKARKGGIDEETKNREETERHKTDGEVKVVARRRGKKG